MDIIVFELWLNALAYKFNNNKKQNIHILVFFYFVEKIIVFNFVSMKTFLSDIIVQIWPMYIILYMLS